MKKIIKSIIITDDLDIEFKYLTCNQIKLILIALNTNLKINLKTILYHKSNIRFKRDFKYLSYLKPKIDQILKIKNTVIDKSNPQKAKEQLTQLRNSLRNYTYYKIPIKVAEELIYTKLTKTQLLFILKFYSILRMTFQNTYTYNINEFIKSVFDNISNKEMCIKRKILKEISNIKVINSNIKVTISNIKVIISNIKVTDDE